MIGIYNAPSDVANATPTYQNQANPVVFKNGNTTSQQLFSYAGAVQSFSFDQNNQSVYRELVGGSKEVLITDRRPGGSIVLEAVTMATKNYFTASLALALATTRSSTGKLLATSLLSAHLRLICLLLATQILIQMLNFDYIATPNNIGQ